MFTKLSLTAVDAARMPSMQPQARFQVVCSSLAADDVNAAPVEAATAAGKRLADSRARIGSSSMRLVLMVLVVLCSAATAATGAAADTFQPGIKLLPLQHPLALFSFLTLLLL